MAGLFDRYRKSVPVTVPQGRRGDWSPSTLSADSLTSAHIAQLIERTRTAWIAERLAERAAARKQSRDAWAPGASHAAMRPGHAVSWGAINCGLMSRGRWPGD